MNRRPLLVLIILVALFLLPVILARVFYTHQSWLPQHKTNRGRLVNPVVSIRALGLDSTITQKHWVMMFIHLGVCDPVCQKALYNMQQIQRALGKDSDRVKRAWLTDTPSAVDGYGATVWQTSAAALAQAPNQPAAWYIVDPEGNIVLSYSAEDNPEAMLDDLKHLIGVSSD